MRSIRYVELTKGAAHMAAQSIRLNARTVLTIAVISAITTAALGHLSALRSGAEG